MTTNHLLRKNAEHQQSDFMRELMLKAADELEAQAAKIKELELDAAALRKRLQALIWKWRWGGFDLTSELCARDLEHAMKGKP